MSNAAPLKIFVQCLKSVSVPRSKQSVSQPFSTVLAVAPQSTRLGLIARRSTIAEIERWAKIHTTQLQQFLEFRKTGAPSDSTMTRVLRKLSLEELQAAFAQFLNALLQSSQPLAAADGNHLTGTPWTKTITAIPSLCSMSLPKP